MKWSIRVGDLVLLLAVWVAPAFGITATPTATPIIQQVGGSVRIPGELGLVAAAGVRVEAFPCGFSACLDAPAVVVVDTGADGAFVVPLRTNGPAIARALIDAEVLRALTVSGQVLVDPISEAIVQLLEQRELASYSSAQLLAIEAAVRQANADQAFAGLTIVAAVDLALQRANADASVTALLAPWTPVPNPTATATPTPSTTATPYPAVATATRRGCIGDCDASGAVQINEIIVGVAQALGTSISASCPAFLDFTVSELVRAAINALEGCVLPPPLPDLTLVEGSISGHGRKCQSPDRCVMACVVNSGDAAAGPFDLHFTAGRDDDLAAALPGLAAGDSQCVLRCADGIAFAGTAVVDPQDVVGEHRERNNEATYAIATPTPTVSCP